MKGRAFTVGFLGAAVAAGVVAWYLRWSCRQFDNQGG